MDFGWTGEQQELHRGALEFGEGRLRRAAAERAADPDRWREDWRACGEGGFLGLCASAEHGGLGLDFLTTAHAIEGLARGCRDTGLVFAACAHLFACVHPIDRFASEELRRRHLPALTSGEHVGAAAASEPEAGSDVYAMATTAVRDGDAWVLSGEKSWVTNGPVADVYLVYAATNPQHGYFGLSAFLVERDTPGLDVGRPLDKHGLTGAPLCSIHLAGCRVPHERMVGAEGQGGRIFAASMQAERTCLFASYLGVMDRQLAETIEYARARRQFGRPIADNQAVSHRIADMRLRLDAARLLLYRACWLADRGEEAALETSLAKIAVSEAAVRSGIDAVRVHGAAGVVRETGVEDALQDALPATIFSGTSDMQREIVASRLGL